MADQDPPDAPVIDARDEPATLATRIALAMAEVAAVDKDRENKDQHYRYASVEAMKKAVRGPLLQQGVALFMVPRGTVESSEVTSSQNKKGERVEARFDFKFTGHGDELVIEGWLGVGVDYADKAYSKAVTSALKTFINAQWLLPAEADDDPDHATPEYGQRAAAPATAPPAWAAPASDETKRELVLVLERLIGHRQTAIEYASTLTMKTGGFPETVAQWVIAISQWQQAAQQRAKQPAPAASPEAQAQDAAAEAPDPPAEQLPDVPVCGSSYRGSQTVTCVRPKDHDGPHRAGGGGEWQETLDGGGTMDPEPEQDTPAQPGSPTFDAEIEAAAAEQARKRAEEAGIETNDIPVVPSGTIHPPGAWHDLPDSEHIDRLRTVGCICPNPLDAEGRLDTCPIAGHGIPF